MILPILMLLAAQAAPTLAMIEGLSPQAAGELVLANRTHGPIVQVVATKTQPMAPPGSIERQFLEAPVAGAEGCVRRRWTVMFHHGPGVAPDQATPMSSMALTEVALPGAAGCPADGYVRLNPGLEPAQGLPALKRLNALGRGEAKAVFTCSDQTKSDLCGDPETLHRKLAALSPWALSRRDGRMVFWLGVPGQVVTEVSYAVDRPEQVAVSRQIPPPF
jgi:hypothetical protein